MIRRRSVFLQIDLGEAEGRLSAGILSYMRESRRLRNDKMLRDLGIQLIHPDLDAGLEACFAETP